MSFDNIKVEASGKERHFGNKSKIPVNDVESKPIKSKIPVHDVESKPIEFTLSSQ